MKLTKRQEVLKEVRAELNISHGELSDEELWEGVKDSFLCKRVELGIAQRALMTAIKSVINQLFIKIKKNS